MTIASSIGADVFPVVSGQLMEDYPMTLMYLTTITIISCSILFMLAIFIGGKITHQNKSTYSYAYSELKTQEYLVAMK